MAVAIALAGLVNLIDGVLLLHRMTSFWTCLIHRSQKTFDASIALSLALSLSF